MLISVDLYWFRVTPRLVLSVSSSCLGLSFEMLCWYFNIKSDKLYAFWHQCLYSSYRLFFSFRLFLTLICWVATYLPKTSCFFFSYDFFSFWYGKCLVYKVQFIQVGVECCSYSLSLASLSWRAGKATYAKQWILHTSPDLF